MAVLSQPKLTTHWKEWKVRKGSKNEVLKKYLAFLEIASQVDAELHKAIENGLVPQSWINYTLDHNVHRKWFEEHIEGWKREDTHITRFQSNLEQFRIHTIFIRGELEALGIRIDSPK